MTYTIGLQSYSSWPLLFDLIKEQPCAYSEVSLLNARGHRITATHKVSQGLKRVSFRNKLPREGEAAEERKFISVKLS